MAPIDILPDDILIEVLKEILDPQAFDTTRLYWIQIRDLSLVCRGWRETIQNARAFQAVIPINAPDEVMERLIRRSGTAPLTIGYNHDPSLFPVSLPAAVRSVEQAHRWKAASMWVPSAQLRDTISRASFPMLEFLDISVDAMVDKEASGPFLEGDDPSVSEAPNLRHLQFTGARIPWAIIRNLRFLDLEIRNDDEPPQVVDFCNALLSCPQLEYLKYIGQSFEGSPVPQDISPIRMPYLRDLEMDIGIEVTNYVQSRLLLPPLTKLQARIFVPPPNPNCTLSGEQRDFQTRLVELVSTYPRAFVFGIHRLHRNYISCSIHLSGNRGVSQSRVFLHSRNALDMLSWIGDVLARAMPARVILDTFDPSSVVDHPAGAEAIELVRQFVNVHCVEIDSIVDNDFNVKFLRIGGDQGPRWMFPQIRQMVLCIVGPIVLRQLAESIAALATSTLDTEVDPDMTLVLWMWCDKEEDFDDLIETVQKWVGAGKVALRYSEDDWDICQLDDWMVSADGLDLWKSYARA